MWYTVKNWDTNETISNVMMTLKEAKDYCRAMGHTENHNGKWYDPVAYVEDENGNCVYNPRFKVK